MPLELCQQFMFTSANLQFVKKCWQHSHAYSSRKLLNSLLINELEVNFFEFYFDAYFNYL